MGHSPDILMSIFDNRVPIWKFLSGKWFPGSKHTPLFSLDQVCIFIY